MLEGLKRNINSLLALYEGEKERADALEAELEALRGEVGTYRKQITDLNRKIDNIKLSGALGGAAASKERLGKLISEIDACIRLLEK